MIVLRKTWESPEKVLRKVWEISIKKKVLRKSWKGPEKVLRKTWEIPEKVLTKSWESPEQAREISSDWNIPNEHNLLIWTSIKSAYKQTNDQPNKYPNIEPLKIFFNQCLVFGFGKSGVWQYNSRLYRLLTNLRICFHFSRKKFIG